MCAESETPRALWSHTKGHLIQLSELWKASRVKEAEHVQKNSKDVRKDVEPEETYRQFHIPERSTGTLEEVLETRRILKSKRTLKILGSGP